jgi:septal ring factor EnvC (AmiA/AmiB activator)
VAQAKQSAGNARNPPRGRCSTPSQAFAEIESLVGVSAHRIAALARTAAELAAESERMQTNFNEVAADAEQSSAATEQVSASSEQTNASTEAICASMQELAGTAKALAGLVERFHSTSSRRLSKPAARHPPRASGLSVGRAARTRP